jgi:hypothetical protein
MEIQMKKLFTVLFLVLVFALVFLLSQAPIKVAAVEEEGAIPASALRGNYADALHGSFALCLNSSFVEVSCTSTGATVFPQSIVTAGHVAIGKSGACETGTEIISDLPVDISPPAVIPFQNVAKPIDYDPKTGTGDSSETTYTGGKCNGAQFDSTGATVISTGTVHFVASDNGKRIEGVVTALTDPTSGIADFSLSFVQLRQ